MMPDNGGYATAAYVAAAIIYVMYAMTIRSRTKRLMAQDAALSEHDGGRR